MEKQNIVSALAKSIILAFSLTLIFAAVALADGPLPEPTPPKYIISLPIVVRNFHPEPPEPLQRGAALAYGDTHCQDIEKLNAGWHFNWGETDPCPHIHAEFVPMIWGKTSAVPVLVDDGEWLMGFNEPNYKGQAVMLPEEAAAMWPYLEATGRKLVSPAVAACESSNPNCLYDPYQWMDEFFEACQECRIDAIGVHWYGGPGASLEAHLEKMAVYGKPLWLTEFGFTWENILYCMKEALPIVRKMTVRHAWFAARLDPALMPPDAYTFGPLTLIDPQTDQLTALGEWYSTH